MTDPKKPATAGQQGEDTEAQKKEGHGLVPNVTEQTEGEGKVGELKEALHELEEEKGDWGKDR